MVKELASREETSGRPTVVVAEDDEILRRYFVDVLEFEGYEVLSAGDGIDAFQLVYDRPDTRALVTDIDMPRMDGFTLARWVREIRDNLDVIYVSGRHEVELIGRRVPGSLFLSKPCTPDSLLCAMQGLLGPATLHS